VNLPIFGTCWDTLVIRIDFPHRQPGGLAGGSAAGGGHHCLDRRPRGSPERAAKHQRRQRRAAWCGGDHQLIGGRQPTHFCGVLGHPFGDFATTVCLFFLMSLRFFLKVCFKKMDALQLEPYRF